jgi:hypothetical protein
MQIMVQHKQIMVQHKQIIVHHKQIMVQHKQIIIQDKRMLYEAFFISFWCSLSIKSSLPSFVSNTLKSSLNSGFMINKEAVCINEVFFCTPQSLNIFMPVQCQGQGWLVEDLEHLR